MEPYTENQKFNQLWLKLVIIIPFVTVIGSIVFGEPNSAQTTNLIISFAILGAITALFYLSKLDTRIDEKGITLRYFPFQRYYYFVGWDEIEEAYIRQYKPIMEYGGWGLRYTFRNGKAYNVRGNKGLQLVLKSGKKFLIGTQNETGMQSYLSELKARNAIACIK
ncbi:MAG: hypothetical protein Q8M15_11205 [Bacteroidota bacterium]|nr:hypothetical protein [Bacteroidota bacterium]